jgi:hypothetical protein
LCLLVCLLRRCAAASLQAGFKNFFPKGSKPSNSANAAKREKPLGALNSAHHEQRQQQRQQLMTSAVAAAHDAEIGGAASWVSTAIQLWKSQRLQ